MCPGSVLFWRNQLLGTFVPEEMQQTFLKLKMKLIAVNYLVASESVYSNMLWCAVTERF